MLPRAGHTVHFRSGTGVDGNHIKSHRRPSFAMNDLVPQINPGDGRMVKLRPGKTRQLPHIQMRLIKAVVPRDEAGQHPGIRRVDIARNHRDPHPGQRIHSEIHQDAHMRMPAADQDKLLLNALRGGIHGAIFRTRDSLFNCNLSPSSSQGRLQLGRTRRRPVFGTSRSALGLEPVTFLTSLADRGTSVE